MPSNLAEAYDLSNVDALFKIKFLKYYDETFNTTTPLWNQTTKTNDFVGKKLEFPVPTTYKGGVGSGRLPESKPATYGDVQITAKKVYATDRVDRETIMASLTSEGAFVRALAETVKKTVQADMWNHSRILFGNGDGSLGTIDTGGVTDNGGGDYDVVISSASFKLANWEENMFVNFGTGTDKFEITLVAPSTRTISVQRQAGGTDVPADADVVYLQNSKDNDPQGLKSVLDATSGSLYNVTVTRKWQAYQRAMGGVGISTPIMNKAMIQVELQSGQVPNMIVTSAEQFEKVLNFLEDQKRYQMVNVPAKGAQGKVSFQGVQFMSARGPINIFWDRFCEPDRMYFLNTRHIKYYRRPNTGWVKDDIGGNGYLRVADEDQFEARFATYGEIFIAPTFHGVVTGLSIT